MESCFVKQKCSQHAKASLRIICYLQIVLYDATLGAALSQINNTYMAMFAFGDSIVDTGNNNNLISLVKSNFPPYGRYFPNAKPTGRFSNGKVISDLLAEGLDIKEYLPAYLDSTLQNIELQTGLSFASAGSGYDPLTSKLTNAYSPSDQIGFFKEYKAKLRGYVGEEKSKVIIANSLYLISLGNNDIAFTYFLSRVRKLQLDVTSYTDLLVRWASNFLKELYELGARDFALLSVAPLGCLPGIRTVEGSIKRNCVEKFNQAAQLYNSKLSSEIISLQRQFPDTKIILLDFYDPLLEIIQEPSKFGFEVADKGCCGTGQVEAAILCNKLFDLFSCTNTSAYVFFDAAHPSQRTYELLVSQYLSKIFSQAL